MPEDDVNLLDEDFSDIFSDTKVVQDKPVESVTPVAAKPVVPVAKVEPVAQEKADMPVVSEDAVAKEIEDMMKPVGFGTRVSNVPIPRFKGKVDFKARVAILSDKVWPVKVHYEQGIGSFICFEGACCDEGLPRVKYIIPIMQYNTDKNGKPVDQSIEVKALTLGADAYSALADTVSMSGRNITDVDVIVSCSDEGYQKLTFSADAASKCLWKSFETAKEKYAYYKKNVSKLYLACGRVLSEDAYKRKKGLVSASSKPVGNTAPVPPMKDLLE